MHEIYKRKFNIKRKYEKGIFSQIKYGPRKFIMIVNKFTYNFLKYNNTENVTIRPQVNKSNIKNSHAAIPTWPRYYTHFVEIIFPLHLSCNSRP